MCPLYYWFSSKKYVYIYYFIFKEFHLFAILFVILLFYDIMEEINLLTLLHFICNCLLLFEFMFLLLHRDAVKLPLLLIVPIIYFIIYFYFFILFSINFSSLFRRYTFLLLEAIFQNLLQIL